MFSFEYCQIFKNIYFEEYLRTAASDYNRFVPVPEKVFLPIQEWDSSNF